MPKLKEINLDGHRLAALVHSESETGLPILFLHGVMSSVNFWTRDILDLFSPYGPCISLSLPGHYPACFAPGFKTLNLTPTWLADQLCTAIRELIGDKQVLLVGHSTGGFAALAAAAFHPDLAAGVISIAGFAQGRWGIELRPLQRLARHEQLGNGAFRLLLGLGGIGPLFRLTAPLHTPLPPQVAYGVEYRRMVAESLSNFRAFSPQAMQTYFAAMWQADISAELKQLSAPALILSGDADLAVPTSQSDLIAACLPNAERVVVRGAGHHPFYEQPVKFQSIVSSWLMKYFNPLEVKGGSN